MKIAIFIAGIILGIPAGVFAHKYSEPPKPVPAPVVKKADPEPTVLPDDLEKVRKQAEDAATWKH